MDTDAVFIKLKSILEQYEPSLTVIHNTADNYYLNTIPDKTKKPEFFGAVQVKKSYVAFHLMPIYYFPDLLEAISQELKGKMQGKSCFNFRNFDEKLFEEIDTLTKRSFNKYRELNKV